MKQIAQARVQADGRPYRQTIQTGAFELIADEPPSAGGQGAGPAPYDYLLASLAACTTITLQMYAQRKGWPLDGLSMELSLLKNAAGETRIERVIQCASELDDAQWQRLLDIAGKTPVTRTLLSGATIHTTRAPS